MTKTKIKNGNVSRKNTPKAAKVDETALLNKLMSKMGKAKEPTPKISPLGRVVLDAGNAVSGFFGGGKIFGAGAYKLQGSNTSWDIGNQVPAMHSTNSSVRFAHKEYIGQVLTSTLFTMQYNEQVNPTNQVLFPYLSGMASNFQEYRFKGLCFYFKSTSADALNSTNTALGAIIMAAQYRADAPAPTSKVQMLNEMWSNDGRPSANIGMPIECSPAECPLNILYCGDGQTGTNDPKFYNLAQFYLASQGSQAAADAGELWVTYDIELYKPILSLSAGPFQSNCARYGATAVTTANQIGTPFIYRHYGLPIVVSLAGGNLRLTIVSPGLGAALQVSILGEAATTAVYAFAAVAGATLSSTLANNTDTAASSGIIGSPLYATFTCFLVSDTSAGSDVVLDVTGTYVGAATIDIFITQVVPALLGV